jgi:transposase InsO family protein
VGFSGYKFHFMANIKEQPTMISMLKLLFLTLKALFGARGDLIVENLSLRQQLIVYQRSVKRPNIKNTDRIFWVWLSRIWNDWRSSLIIVKPHTVIGWHKKGFKLYWKRKTRRVGRPNIDWELIKLIRRMQKENPTWSPQRIQGELAKLGFSVCDNTVAKYMRKPISDNGKRQRWLTFLRNHAKHIVGIDFFVARTIFFKAIYVFIAISHGRRKILHFGVTSNPNSQWAIQQLRESFAFDENTKYVIRDNDKIFSEDFKTHIKRFGLEDTPTAPRSPWQNPIAERVILTLRNECLDHMIIINEKHLYNVLHEYIFEYYNVSRTHMSLEKDSPEQRPIQKDGKIVSKPILGGLHHVYSRVA